MVFKHRRLKLEVTVNGDGWDKPIGVDGEKRFLQPQTFNLRFPNPTGRNTSRIALTDVVRLYAGMGYVEDDPLFTGFMVGKENKHPITLQFTSYAGLAEQPKRKVDSFSNFDGLECSYAIQKALEYLDCSNYATALSFQCQGTNPVNVVHSSFRKGYNTSLLAIVKGINKYCLDMTPLPESPLPYVFYEVDTTFYHRKLLPIDGSVDAPFTFKTIDDIAAQPRTVLSSLITKATVVGAAYTDEYGRERNHEATYEAEGGTKLKRLFHVVVTDKSLTSFNDCMEKAKQLVETGLTKTIRTTIDSFDLLHALPSYSIMEVENSIHDLDGIHRITDLSVSLGSGKNSVQATLNTQKPLIGGVL